jgi:hypothetical protein
MNRIRLPSGVSEMEHLHHSFADRTCQGRLLKSDLTAATKQQMQPPSGAIASCLLALPDQPHKPRPADPRKPGACFRRQRNKLLSRVKLRLRYRLSWLRSIRSTESTRNAAMATSRGMQHRSVWILRLQSSYSRYMPFSPPSS